MNGETKASVITCCVELNSGLSDLRSKITSQGRAVGFRGRRSFPGVDNGDGLGSDLERIFHIEYETLDNVLLLCGLFREEVG